MLRLLENAFHVNALANYTGLSAPLPQLPTSDSKSTTSVYLDYVGGLWELILASIGINTGRLRGKVFCKNEVRII